jgi:hypothetical protein
MRRSPALTTAVAVCAIAMSSCGSNHEFGSVVGDYRLVGGPAPGINQGLRGTIWAYRGRVARDDALNSTAVAYVVRTDSRGRFDLRLPVGEFTVFGSHGSSSSLRRSGCGSRVVDVHASESQSVHVVCDIP